MERELNNLKEYLLSKSSEDAKRPLVYPFFKKLFGKNLPETGFELSKHLRYFSSVYWIVDVEWPSKKSNGSCL